MGKREPDIMAENEDYFPLQNRTRASGWTHRIKCITTKIDISICAQQDVIIFAQLMPVTYPFFQVEDLAAVILFSCYHHALHTGWDGCSGKQIPCPLEVSGP